MLYPTIDQLTKGKFNRYELALATAKCARLITNEYVRQHDAAEKSITGNKETDRPINTMIDPELRDEKAVHVAVNRLKDGVYCIDPEAGDISVIEEAQAARRAATEAAAAEARAARIRAMEEEASDVAAEEDVEEENDAEEETIVEEESLEEETSTDAE